MEEKILVLNKHCFKIYILTSFHHPDISLANWPSVAVFLLFKKQIFIAGWHFTGWVFFLKDWWIKWTAVSCGGFCVWWIGNELEKDNKLFAFIDISSLLFFLCCEKMVFKYTHSTRGWKTIGFLDALFNDSATIHQTQYSLYKLCPNQCFPAMQITNFLSASVLDYKQSELKLSVYCCDIFCWPLTENILVFCLVVYDHSSSFLSLLLFHNIYQGSVPPGALIGIIVYLRILH